MENYFEIMFDKLCKTLQNEGTVKSVSEEFKNLRSDYERVDFLMKLKPVLDIVILPKGNEGKSLERSQQLRNEGNKHFHGKNFLTALQKYSESLASSPWPSADVGDTKAEDNCFALAFANRSAVLVHLDEHKLAIADIEKALKYGYPKQLRYKLLERKGRCLLAMGQQEEAAASLEAASVAVEDSDMKTGKMKQWKNDLQSEIIKCRQAEANCVRDMERIRVNGEDSFIQKWDSCRPDVADGNDSTFVALSQACGVKYEPGQGRFIVALRDISPGEVLLVEKPYASIVLPDHHMNHCYHCFVRTIALQIPCRQCCFAMYCSDKCQAASWDCYHRFECSILGILQTAGVDKFAYLALRTLANTPCDQILSYRMAVEARQFQTENRLLYGGDENKQYTSNSYNTICNLVTHADNRNSHDLFRRAIIAIFLLQCLRKSGYFDVKCEASDIQTYVGGLLLSHLQSFPCNAHEISEFALDTGAVVESVPHELGAGIYATLSLFNHSCDPAVSRNFYADVCVVRAIRSIRKDCEVSDNYGAVYAMQSREERQKKLRAQYFFDCRCDACVNNWPMLSDVKSSAPRWRCNSCAVTLPMSGAVTDSMIKCSSCGKLQNLREKLFELVESGKAYRVAFDQLLKCDVIAALPTLLSHLAKMDALISVPWMDHSCCQEAVKQCFSIMANCFIKNKQKAVANST